MLNKRVLIFVFLVLCLFSSISYAQSNSVSILFVGNSLTFVNKMPVLLAQVADSKGKEVKVDYQECQPGYKLSQHWQNKGLLQKIRSGNWDIVVIQENGSIPVTDKKIFHQYVRLFNEEIEKAGAEMFLYITARRRYPGIPLAPRQEPITEAYQEIASELAVRVVPVGPAWVEVYTRDMGLELYGVDNLHPSLAGAYFTACVFYASIFNDSPVGAENILKQQVDSEQVSELQQIAWDEVANYKAGLIDSQKISAITEKGQGVILYPDGSWQRSYNWGMNKKNFLELHGQPDSQSYVRVLSPGSKNDIRVFNQLFYKKSLAGINYQVSYSFSKKTDKLTQITYYIDADYIRNIKGGSPTDRVIKNYFANLNDLKVLNKEKLNITTKINKISAAEIVFNILEKGYSVFWEKNKNYRVLKYLEEPNQIILKKIYNKGEIRADI